MPIYAYKCGSCGHEQDVLQKMSDPVLTVCPECGQESYVKQVTAAGFQLKGSGWYVTDFRNNGSGGKASGSSSGAGDSGSSTSAASSPGSSSSASA
ncbi:MAG TPA: FmdB family zinc ribbon protein [Burkholderiaceae bacterium]|nr:FmdB family zinc ribbon protein [Burkholderiaceae bacterium]